MSKETRLRDGLAALYPQGTGDMPVAWRQMRIPAPPPEFALTREELEHPDPNVRYARRTIQHMDAAGDRLALVDKAIPHAQYDLMISGLSDPPHPGPCDVPVLTGRLLWRTAGSFVRFVSQSSAQREHGLEGGSLHLALNCDPNTRDRESCQANKQFHLHLLYWTSGELAPVSKSERAGGFRDPLLHRQVLDPLAFLGARMIHEALADLPLGIPGAALLPFRERDAIDGGTPLGCLLRLPGWGVLDDPAFESLVRGIHRRIADTSAQVLAAFTGGRKPLAPWHRHNLLPRPRILENLEQLPLSEQVQRGLRVLAERLRDLSPGLAERLRHGPPARRKHHMVLNQPSYALNLSAAAPNRPEQRLQAAGDVYLILQTKLFSGIGGAGLLSLGDVPSVRILRGKGTFSREQWHHRARFQHDFACFNAERLADMQDIALQPVRRFADTSQGWTELQ